MAALSMATGFACSNRPGILPSPKRLHSSAFFTGTGAVRSCFFEGLQICGKPSNASRRRAPRGLVVAMSFEAGVGLLGTKVGMMRKFMPDGTAIPVTVIGFHDGNIVTQVKRTATEGYDAVQIGYRRVRADKINKPETGHLNKAGVTMPLRHLQEFRLVNVDGFEPGQKLQPEEVFKVGDLVDVSGKSLGKGFQGGIKRHGFKRGPMSHGSKSHRLIGSIGAGTTPGRVLPGKKMPGRMGFKKRKIRKLQVIEIDPELRCMVVKGSVPGKRGNLLRITPAKIVGVNIPKN